MDKLLDIMPVILLAGTQLLQSITIINLIRRIRALEEYQDMVLKCVHDTFLEVLEDGKE